jgi:hypothetical protein
MKTFWVSWWSGNYEDEGCTKPPFQFWVSGQKDRPNYGLTQRQVEEANLINDEDVYDEYMDTHSRDDCSLCAVIKCENEDGVWELVSRHFPDYVPRFCDEKESNFCPGGRFPT